MSKYVPTIHPWNQRIWQSLTNEPDRANHAVLFNGNQGLGKLDLAVALAHFVLTETHGQSEALFDAATHPDFHVVMPEQAVLNLEADQSSANNDAVPGSAQQASLVATYAHRYLQKHGGKPKRTISIDQVRNLNEALTTFPHISKYRVIIIARAETMNRNAANALLKSLEEPPANTLFVIVSDEASKLAKTVRSRCSLVNFRAPDRESAEAWLELQNVMPVHDVASHLAMANNHPLLACRLFRNDYIDTLKSVFTDVNGLWNRSRQPLQVAQNWQKIGALRCVEILQKLTTDLLRCSLSEAPAAVFFPVQESWVKSVSSRISRAKLLDAVDELIYARKMLSTTVDELLVLEAVSLKLRQLPAY
ncbi:MAG: hypothetical protein HKN85_02170 [Gammaproteobacteria bacterium]|nr:hypothetical protein [Gammaproteobacteria bacterium]